MTQRLLCFSIKNAPHRDAWLDKQDVDIEEPFVGADGELEFDLRGFLWWDNLEGHWWAYLYKNENSDENCMYNDENAMLPVHAFPPSATMDEMTQWLWLKVAIFNEDTGKLDAGHFREDSHD